MKLRRITRVLVRVFGWLAAAAILVAGTILSYQHVSRQAAERLAETKQFKLKCPTSSLQDCTFTEIPVKIDTFFDIVVPTVALSCGLALVIILTYALIRKRHYIGERLFDGD